jgi:membrane protease YdiL (CAAX protease family)
MSTDSTQPTQSIHPKERLAEWFCLGAIITMAYWVIPLKIFSMTWGLFPNDIQTSTNWSNWYWQLLCLGFSLLLVCGSWKRSGLRIGSIGRHWRGVLIVCGIPVVISVIANLLMPNDPFSNWSFHMWLISPWSQDLVFSGYLYGRFEQIAPSYIHKKFRIRWALVIAAAFFSLHHLTNFYLVPSWLVITQLVYSFLGMILYGLSRQWTGSMLYGTASHIAVNLISSIL